MRVLVDEPAASRADEVDVRATSGEAVASQTDPRHQRAIAHLQTADWADAIRRLEELARACPGDKAAQRALDDARFRASLDAKRRVRGRRWIIPWRGIVFYLLIVAAVGLLGTIGVRAVRDQIVPAVAQAQVDRVNARLLAEASAYLEAGHLDAAEARYRELLAQVPTHDGALRGLERSAAQRELLDLYGQAVAVQEAGDHGAAMAKLEQISMSSPGYRDVEQRMARIGREQELARVFGEAEADREAGRYEEALGKYEQVEALDAGHRAEEIVERRYEAHMALGQELIGGDGATSEAVGEAVEHFGEALALKPRSGEAALERRLARLYLEGEGWYLEGDWDGAAARLEGVYGRRPGYLGGTMVEMLYEAYVWSGDAHRSAGDRQFAYEQYRRAAALPVEDNTLALDRVDALAPKVTPTPIPVPTQTPIPAPTPVPAKSEGTFQVLLAPNAERPVPPNIEIVLDASRSMWAEIQGRPRIEIARQVLGQFLDELPNEVNVALRAYGHQYDAEQRVCTDTELLVPLALLDRVGLMAHIQAINPQGMTPIGNALAQLENDLVGATGQSVVVLVSDGEESCDADPCKVADGLVASGLDVRVYVIGYAVDDPPIADQLACIAEVTGGSYLPVGSAQELIAALREAVTVGYAVYDRDGAEVARGMIDGEPITLPSGTYRVEVLAGAPLVSEGVVIRGDQQTTLEVATSGGVASAVWSARNAIASG